MIVDFFGTLVTTLSLITFTLDQLLTQVLTSLLG